MPRYDFISQRLYIDRPLATGKRVDLERNQSNYLINVLRHKDGAPILVFNGKDGEWQAQLEISGRKKAALLVVKQTREQTVPYDLEYWFAPLKQARLEYMVQKAVEMGVGILQPVLTEFTQLRKLNFDRMAAHTVEAAEQCGILTLPTIREPLTLRSAVDSLPEDRRLIFCDEGEHSQNPLPALSQLQSGPLCVLIGPEGGFSPAERDMLRSHPQTTPIPLGPRVLRADTAAIAALAIIQAMLGDWKPNSTSDGK
ncbi:MAG: 16S rRNA (uracil(1498)-N(3))-methyltransferase [Rhizobiaceae bacterium]